MAVTTPIPSQFNDWMGWPTRPKPYMVFPYTYSAAAYLNAFLAYHVSQPTTPGETVYNANTFWGVVNFQTFWGLTVDGQAGPQTMGVVDWLCTTMF